MALNDAIRRKIKTYTAYTNTTTVIHSKEVSVLTPKSVEVAIEAKAPTIRKRQLGSDSFLESAIAVSSYYDALMIDDFIEYEGKLFKITQSMSLAGLFTFTGVYNV